MTKVYMSILFIIVLFSFTAKANSKFHCVGTCYSGRTFPKPEDIVHGKHLKGYSYKNITTDDPKKCYSSCVYDCRCKACQMKDSRCELLDEDKTTRADDFVDESGYVYYDIKQEFYKGKSHMVQPGVCQNGCCRSQPCLNGGTCVEHCGTPKEKFSCRCTKSFTGKVCEKYITRCYDVLKYLSSSTIPANGNYTITRIDNWEKTPLICAFTSNRSWTLIESYSLANNKYFMGNPLYVDNKRNLNNPNWEDYRISVNRMSYVRSTATLFRATCDFPNRVDSLTPDYLLGNLSDVDITSRDEPLNQCKNYMHINILGHECFDCTAATFAIKDKEHIHIDVYFKSMFPCNFNPKLGYQTDSFGFYNKVEKSSKCTATLKSTTQWWLGEEK